MRSSFLAVHQELLLLLCAGCRRNLYAIRQILTLNYRLRSVDIVPRLRFP